MPDLSPSTVKNAASLIRIVTLSLIAGAAVASRLFAVVNFESIIHELYVQPVHVDCKWAEHHHQRRLSRVYLVTHGSTSMFIHSTTSHRKLLNTHVEILAVALLESLCQRDSM